MLIFGVCHDMSFDKRLSSRQHLQAESSTAFHIQLLRILVDSRNQNWDTGKKTNHINPIPTVDGWNLAPVDVVDIPVFMGFCTSQVVQDFFHQQYVYGSCVFLAKDSHIWQISVNNSTDQLTKRLSITQRGSNSHLNTHCSGWFVSRWDYRISFRGMWDESRLKHS